VRGITQKPAKMRNAKDQSARHYTRAWHDKKSAQKSKSLEHKKASPMMFGLAWMII